VQRDIGPGALLSLVGGALRLDATTFRRVAADPTLGRLCYAVVVIASLANGFGYAMEGVAGGMVGERDFPLYRLLVLVGVVETVLQFALFSALVWLVRVATRRRPAVGFGTLTRILGLALAPACFVFLGPLIGFATPVRGVLTVWRIACCVVALRAVTDASWLGAVVTVLAADLLAAPLVSLVLFGWPSAPAPAELPT
jgi:hypothetical protein